MESGAVLAAHHGPYIRWEVKVHYTGERGILSFDHRIALTERFITIVIDVGEVFAERDILVQASFVRDPRPLEERRHGAEPLWAERSAAV